MADKNETGMTNPKQELVSADNTERTRERQVFVPNTDIFETADEIILTADIPGANQDSIEVILDQDVLTIEAIVENEIPEGYRTAYNEYSSGDFHRTFRLTSEIERDEIQATVKNGELTLRLPKSEGQKTKRITVKAE